MSKTKPGVVLIQEYHFPKSYERGFSTYLDYINRESAKKVSAIKNHLLIV